MYNHLGMNAGYNLHSLLLAGGTKRQVADCAFVSVKFSRSFVYYPVP